MDERPNDSHDSQASNQLRQWEQLLAEVKDGTTQVSLDHLTRLLEKLATADDPAYRTGIALILHEILARIRALETSGGAGPTKRHALVGQKLRRLLGTFLLEPLLDPSLVFYTQGENRDVRDEPAMITLLHAISPSDYPEAELHQILMGVDAWQEFTVDERCKCLVFIGRVGLFGEEAVKEFVDKPFALHDVRFKFRKDVRDPRMKQDDFKNDFYCLDEYEKGKRVATYRTRKSKASKKKAAIRVDFAVVQRFKASDGTVVLLIAGLSSLGTLGATMWLVNRLRAGQEFWAPDSASGSSKCEVLLEVTADEIGARWNPRKIVARSLYLDDKVWSFEGKNWYGTGSGLTIFTCNDEPDKVLHNGKPVPFRNNSKKELGRRLLCFAAAAKTAMHGDIVDLAAVAADPRLRVNGKPRSIAYVRNQLKRAMGMGQMKEAMQIDADGDVRFLVKIDFVEKGPDAGGEMTFRPQKG